MRLFIFLLCFFWSSVTIAQSPKPFSKDHILSYPRDSWGILKAPVIWGKKEWGRSIAGAAIIYGAFNLDEDIQKWLVVNGDNPFSTGFLSGSRHWGDGLYSLPVFAGLYFYGKYHDNPKHELTAMNATKAFVLSRILVQIPKYLFQRHPPAFAGERGPAIFDGPLGGGTHRSFPSGHVISCFAAAEVFRLAYDEWWVGGLAYTLATSVALQRMASGSHWFSDVTASVILGTAMGHWISQKGATRFSLYSGSIPHTSMPTLGLVYNF